MAVSSSIRWRGATTRSGATASRMISGAPMTQVPPSEKLAPLHLRAEENAEAAVTTHDGGLPTSAAMRPNIAVGLASFAASAASPLNNSLVDGSDPSESDPSESDPSGSDPSESRVAPSKASIPTRARRPVVSVPVLSRQITSTRARPSTAGSSLTTTLFRARRTTAVAIVMLTRSTRPCGMRATTPATAATRPASTLLPLRS